MVEHRLLALSPGAPEGFRLLDKLRTRDVRAGVFALWATSPEEAESRLPVPPALLTGLLVTPGDATRLVQRPSGLYHLTLGPRAREAPDTLLATLVLLERLEAETLELRRQGFELERSREDLRRHQQEHQEFRDSLGREIAERRLAEAALRESRARLAAIYDSVSDAILIHDPDLGTIVEGNRSARAMLGVESLEGASLAPVVLNRDASNDLLQAGEVPRTVEWRIHRSGTREAWFEANLQRTNLRGHEVVLVTARDVTERKAAEEERRRLELQVQHSQRLESLGVLAGGIAHDFNNLLMAIQGNVDLVLPDLEPGAPAWGPLQEVLRASESASDLCQQILTYSGRGHLDLQQVDLSTLVSETGRMFGLSLPAGTAIHWDLKPDLPPVMGDPTQLRQIAMNLVLNAAEALGEGGGEIRVSTSRVSCSAQDLVGAVLGDTCAPGEFLALDVTDTGCGIDPAARDRLFEPFFTTKILGRGLGLAAVLGIVRGHRGALQVESTLGVGTHFRVLLPALVRPLASASRKASAEPSPQWRWSGTVLVADDEEMLRSLLCHTLERHGFRVVLAEDGREALKLYRELTKVDLVLLDLRMPRMDGLETCRRIRALSPRVPILLMTGYQEGQPAQNLDSLDIQGILQKPFRTRDLRERLRQVMGPPQAG